MRKIQRKPVEKLWSISDINKTLKIVAKAKANKHPKIKILDKFVYWFALLTAIIGNLIISISLIPVLLVFSGTSLYVIIIILGISFGLLFELLIRTLENLKIQHHLLLGIAIPLIAVVNFIIISNNMKKFIGIESTQNPLIIGAVYAVFFILPYLIYQIFLRK